jgi:hypothetical protein
MFRSFFEKYEMAANGSSGTARTQRQMWMMGANKSNMLTKAPANRPDHVELYKKRAEEDCAEILQQLEKTYRCLECGMTYKGSENMGQWRCRAHRGRFNIAGYWECCQGDEISRGCTRSDHVSSVEPLQSEDIHLDMPLWLFNRFSVPTGRFTITKHDNPYLMRVTVHRIENSLY